MIGSTLLRKEQCSLIPKPYWGSGNETITTSTVLYPGHFSVSIHGLGMRLLVKTLYNTLTHSQQMKLHHNTGGRQCSSCRSLDWPLSCRREILQWQLRKARIWKILAMSCCDGSSPFHSYTILLLPGVESTCSLHYHFLLECRSLRLTHPDTQLPGIKETAEICNTSSKQIDREVDRV